MITRGASSVRSVSSHIYFLLVSSFWLITRPVFNFSTRWSAPFPAKPPCRDHDAPSCLQNSFFISFLQVGPGVA